MATHQAIERLRSVWNRSRPGNERARQRQWLAHTDLAGGTARVRNRRTKPCLDCAAGVAADAWASRARNCVWISVSAGCAALAWTVAALRRSRQTNVLLRSLSRSRRGVTSCRSLIGSCQDGSTTLPRGRSQEVATWCRRWRQSVYLLLRSAVVCARGARGRQLEGKTHRYRQPVTGGLAGVWFHEARWDSDRLAGCTCATYSQLAVSWFTDAFVSLAIRSRRDDCCRLPKRLPSDSYPTCKRFLRGSTGPAAIPKRPG